MADLKKKKIAALAAVNAYLQDEEAAAALAAAQAAQAEPVPLPSLWAVAGRQHIMNMRQLIQMKAF